MTTYAYRCCLLCRRHRYDDDAADFCAGCRADGARWCQACGDAVLGACEECAPPCPVSGEAADECEHMDDAAMAAGEE